MKEPTFKEVMSKLARAAPPEWAEFVRAYRLYYQELQSQMVAAPNVDELTKAQGRAQAALGILSLLETCLQGDPIPPRQIPMPQKTKGLQF